MYYRSDWPELGLDGPLSEWTTPRDSSPWQEAGNSKWRWVSKLDDFESQLYGIPMWNLSLEIQDSGDGWLTAGLSNPWLSQRLQEILQSFLVGAPWSHAYVAAKVVPHEPLTQVLIDAGFVEVEHRCLYMTDVDVLTVSRADRSSPFQFRCLATMTTRQVEGLREQMLEICRDVWQQGFGRHFMDDFLLLRAPGVNYILDVMKRNFERVPLENFLVALDLGIDRLCGFTILREQPGMGNPHYTQLLSAVSRAYQGKGVYSGLTRLLVETLPSDTRLLNIIQIENQAMQRAFQQSGRQALANTLVLRRIFDPAA